MSAGNLAVRYRRVMLCHCERYGEVLTQGPRNIRADCCTPVERAWLVETERAGETLCICYRLADARAIRAVWNRAVAEQAARAKATDI